MNEIQEYLNSDSKDFVEGLKLFSKYANNAYANEAKYLNEEPIVPEKKVILNNCLQRFLRQGKGNIEKIDKKVDVRVETQTKKTKIAKTTAKGEKEDFQSLSEKDQETLRTITAERAAIQGKLKVKTISNTQRKKLADKLCQLTDQRKAIWDKAKISSEK